MGNAAAKKKLWSLLDRALTSYFEIHGFSPVPKSMRYVRFRENGLVDVVGFSLSPGGRVDVFLMLYVKELLSLPDGINDLNGPMLEYISDTIGSGGLGGKFYDARLDNPSGLSGFIDGFPLAMDQFGFSYFDRVGSRKEFWEACRESTRQSFESKGLKEAILSGG
jgi:hypothetical protein